VRRAQRLDRRGGGHQRVIRQQQEAVAAGAGIGTHGRPWAFAASLPSMSGTGKAMSLSGASAGSGCARFESTKEIIAMHFSGLRVIREALTGHKGWKPLWRNPEPQPAYDYIIVGGGGHGLATAYYLAKTFGRARIAV